MQSFVTRVDDPKPKDIKLNRSGISCKKEDASLFLLGKKLFSVTEKRYSHGAKIDPSGRERQGNFTIVVLVNSDSEPGHVSEYEKRGRQDIEHSGIQSCEFSSWPSSIPASDIYLN
jgi:hypothetical protein